MKTELCSADLIVPSVLAPAAAQGQLFTEEVAHRLKVLAAFLAIYLIWGSTYLAIRVGVATLPPYLFAATRFLVAGGALYAWLRLTGTAAPERRTWRSATIVGGLLLLGGNGSVTWAEQRVSSGLAALVIGTVPLWMNLLDWAIFGGARPTRLATLGLAAGFAGVGMLVLPHGGASAIDPPLGAAALCASAVCWTLGSLLSRRLTLPRSPLMATAMEMVAGGALISIVGLARGEATALRVEAISRGALGALLYLIVFGSLVAFSAYVWLLRTVPAAHVATYAYVNPAVALLLSVIAGDGRLDGRTLLASAVILSSVALIIKAPRARPSEENEP